MSDLWRLQTRTDSSKGGKIAQYCIKNNCLAMGWSIKDEHIKEKSEKEFNEIRDLRGKIQTFEDYKNLISKYGLYKGKVNESVSRLYSDLKPCDLVWIREKGIYYLGMITDKSEPQYCGDEETLNLDASNQINNVVWYKIGDEADVPGAISTSLIRGKALQRIRKCGPQYSQFIFNEKGKNKIYTDFNMKNDVEAFYSLLTTDDCEDLLCLWLYNKYGYIAIPSTNKKSTELYECVLLDPKTGKHIYPQVKNGKVDIDAKNYEELAEKGEVWLFTTEGKVNHRDKSSDKIHVADSKELFDFVESEEARNILSQSIIKRYEMFKKFGNLK